MNEVTRQLKGSPYRDAVKKWHKELVGISPDAKGLYALDNDLILVKANKANKAIVACVDVKSPSDSNVSWTHEQEYGWFENQGIPVYLITLMQFEKTVCEACGKVDIEIDMNSEIRMERYT